MEMFEDGEDEEAEDQFVGHEESNIDIQLQQDDCDFMEPNEKE